MATKELVEVPLDLDYLTEAGVYMAGYLWGKKIRSPESAPRNVPEIFLQGVADGYGDGMEEMKLRMKYQKATLKKALEENPRLRNKEYEDYLDYDQPY